MNENEIREWSALDSDYINLEDIERKLESDLKEEMSELEGLELDHEKIGNPNSLGETVMNVVWEQFINQIACIAGEDFIKENRGLKLDLRDSAHIQTTDNFAKGKIATHNSNIDYQKRYNDCQASFEHDSQGNVITHTTRTGKKEANLVKGARKEFDKGRPTGSKERGTDMDHTVSAGEIIRDPAANAHLSKEEQVGFANSEANLNEMNTSHNRSKKDTPMKEWLDTPNANGQKPKDIYADPMSDDYLSPELEQQYRDKDEIARKEFEKQKEEGELRSIKAGKQSQKAEALRIGGKALRSVVMGLLASLIKEIIRKLISWFRMGNRKMKTFIESVKEALHSFFSKIKEHIVNAADSFLTTIATAIIGPVVGMIKKAFIFIKQGYSSIKKAIQFLKDPTNKNCPFEIKLIEVGKIVIAGLTAGGAIILSEVIAKALISIPGFAVEIPALGSLSNLFGMFFGALVSGLIGAFALHYIDKALAHRLKIDNEKQQIQKKDNILTTQENLIIVSTQKNAQTKAQVATSISKRHLNANIESADIVKSIKRNNQISADLHSSTSDENADIFNLLDNM